MANNIKVDETKWESQYTMFKQLAKLESLLSLRVDVIEPINCIVKDTFNNVDKCINDSSLNISSMFKL